MEPNTAQKHTHTYSYTSPIVVSGQEVEEEEPQAPEPHAPEPFQWTEDGTADTTPCMLQLSTPHHIYLLHVCRSISPTVHVL